MAKELFDVCLTGNLLTGHNRREVTVNLAQLVGTSIPQAESLLERASCLKSRVDESTAAYYHEIIEETGAEAVIRACLAHAQPASPAPPQRAPEQPIRIEPTPVLEPSTPLAQPDLPDQDTTQPFATPLPAPLARRIPHRLKIGGAALALLLLGAVGVRWLLPAPITPGLAIPLVGESLNLVQPFQQQIEQFWRHHKRPPATPRELGWPGDQALGELATLSVQADGVLVITYHDHTAALAGQTLVLRPSRGDQGFDWDCVGGTLSALERPLECRRTEVK